MNKITIPDFALIVLMGASGSGKSTFARTHFLPTEAISSDFCRGLVADGETDQTATVDAFAVLRLIAAKRLARMKLTVIDATNVQRDARKPLVALAREYHAPLVAIVLDVPDQVSAERNRQRHARDTGIEVIRRQRSDLRYSLRNLQREGFDHVFVLDGEEEIATAVIQREPLANDKRAEHGPFDIIGDVHGCFDELVLLLEKMGYGVDADTFQVEPPAGRKALFVGDLVDRGPKIPQVLKLVMKMVETGDALCVPGNHDGKLMRALNGRNVQVTHGLEQSLAQLKGETNEFRREVARFIDSLPSHYVLDDGKLVVAHAGMKESMIGRERESGAVRDFALYGETTGEMDEFGLPVRLNWASEYHGSALVVYGHTPVFAPVWLNQTINIDTGVVFGGALTALRYPELEIVSVKALRTYAETARRFLPEVDTESAANAEWSAAD